MSRRSRQPDDAERERPDKGNSVVGTENDKRLAMLNALADNADAIKVRDDEMTLGGDEEEADDEQSEDDADVSPDGGEQRVELADGDDETTEQVDQAEPPRKHKLKVNGVEVELTDEQLAAEIARVQKIQAADQYLAAAKAEAARLQQQVQQQPVANPPPQVEKDDFALARAIQMGTEQEAVEAIRSLRRPSVSTDDLPRLVDERLAFQQAADQFRREYPEIVSDPYLMQFVLQADERLVTSGDTRSYADRYKAIGEDIRQWKAKLTAPATTQDKVERKAKVTPIRAASVRAAPEAEEEPDDDPRSVIASMAKARGQGR